MKRYIAKILIKSALWILPLTPESHKEIEPIFNNWVDRLNKEYYLTNQ
jgi:hypothetical protein